MTSAVQNYFLNFVHSSFEISQQLFFYLMIFTLVFGIVIIMIIIVYKFYFVKSCERQTKSLLNFTNNLFVFSVLFFFSINSLI